MAQHQVKVLASASTPCTEHPVDTFPLRGGGQGWGFSAIPPLDTQADSRNPSLSPRQRMMAFHQRAQFFVQHVGIDLGRRDIGMA